MGNESFSTAKVTPRHLGDPGQMAGQNQKPSPTFPNAVNFPPKRPRDDRIIANHNISCAAQTTEFQSQFQQRKKMRKLTDDMLLDKTFSSGVHVRQDDGNQPFSVMSQGKGKLGCDFDKTPHNIPDFLGFTNVKQYHRKGIRPRLED